MAIAATYQSQLSGAQPGLIASWHFDDGGGTSAVDSAGSHGATLNVGATFSGDVQP